MKQGLLGDVGTQHPAIRSLVPLGGEGRVMTVDGYTTEPALLC